ncbi:MAG TPA: hypothetical protein VMF06_17245, partial [Candidatus Limnocylindria bacterium]|nr:hypothetical protein [Candidatus Limnocylindria bacterium]
MKPFFTAWIAAVLAAAGWAHAQEDSVMTKSRWFTQTSSATPAPSATQPFRFTYFGSGLNIGGGSPTLTLPSGTIKPLTTSGSDINYADSAASAAAL